VMEASGAWVDCLKTIAIGKRGRTTPRDKEHPGPVSPFLGRYCWGYCWGIDFKAKRKGPLMGLNLRLLRNTS
jgi:hypothetical protein